MKKNKNFYLSFILPLLILLITCLLVIGSSPLFQTNSWVDSNAMLTMGRGVLHGLTPYKDLMDQRGPLLYLIFGMGAAIKETNFFGVFLLQVINVLIVYWVSFKIVKDMKITKIKEQWLALLGPLSLLATSTFQLSGSPEEFAFTSVLYLLFVVNHYRQDVIDVPLYVFYLLGLNLSLIFWNKYSMVGVFVAFFIWTFILFIYKKRFFPLVKVILASVAGFLTLSILISIWFVWKGALGDLFQIYFIQNLTSYGSTNQSILMKAWSLLFIIGKEISNHYIVVLIIFSGWVRMIFQAKKVSLEVILFLFSLLFVALQHTEAVYYNLIWMPFFAVALIRLASAAIENVNQTNTHRSEYLPIYMMLSISLVILPFINNTTLGQLIVRGERVSYVNKTLDAQARFTTIMLKKNKKPTLLMINSLDQGFYLSTQTLPTTKFFHRLNMTYEQLPVMYESFIDDMDTKKVDFVIVKLNTQPSNDEVGLKKQIDASIDVHLRMALENNYQVKATAKDAGNESFVLLYKK